MLLQGGTAIVCLKHRPFGAREDAEMGKLAEQPNIMLALSAPGGGAPLLS
jgi:hypothetical protein